MLAADGNIYGLPCNATQVLCFDPNTQQATLVGDELPGDSKWAGGVLADDGNIYGIPFDATQVLRFDPPVQVDGRHVFEDIEIGGVTIPAGSSTMTLLGACNRDPALVEDPERFDVTRADTQVLSFGSGIHYCLGAALARLEGEALLGKLLDRYEHWEITEEPAWRNRMTLRGVDALQVRFR